MVSEYSQRFGFRDNAITERSGINNAIAR